MDGPFTWGCRLGYEPRRTTSLRVDLIDLGNEAHHNGRIKWPSCVRYVRMDEVIAVRVRLVHRGLPSKGDWPPNYLDELPTPVSPTAPADCPNPSVGQPLSLPCQAVAASSPHPEPRSRKKRSV